MRFVNLLCILFVFFLTFLPCKAQKPNHGSGTEAVMSFVPRKLDTAYIEQLIRYATAMENRSTDSAIARLDQAFRESKRIGYMNGAAMSLIRLGVCYKRKGDNATALQLTRNALPYCLSAKFDKTTLMWNYHKRMAGCFRVLNEKDSAIVYNFRALDEAYKLDDANKIGEIYNNISILYIQSEYYDKALDYLKKAEAHFDVFNDQRALIYIHMAEAYRGKNDLPNFYYYTRKAQEVIHGETIVTESKYSPWQSVLFNLCEYFSIKKVPDSVIFYAQQSLNGEDKTNPHLHLNSYIYLADGYYQLNKLNKAKEYALLALHINQNSDEALDNRIYLIASQIFEDLGDYKQSLKYLQVYSQRNAVSLDVKKSRAFNEIEGKYRTAEKDKQIAQKQLMLTQSQNKLHEKNLWLSGTAIISVLLIIAIAALYRNYRHKQNLHAEKIQTIQHEREIGDLKAMIKGEEKERSRLARELHDGVVSQLVSVKLYLDDLRKRHSGTIYNWEIDEAFIQVQEAANELRKTAHNMLPDILVQSGLETALSLFCEKIRKTAHLDINFETIGTLPRLHSDIELAIYRMIQELVQNVLKHSLASQTLVQLVFQNDLLSITVEDNGRGCPVDKIDSADGGLNSIKERVKAMQGQFEVTSEGYGTGTTIYIEFDIFMLLKEKIYGHQSSYHG